MAMTRDEINMMRAEATAKVASSRLTPRVEVSVDEFRDEKVTVTRSTSGIRFQDAEHTVEVLGVVLDKSATGSAWVRFELKLENNRRAFADINVVGGNLETIDVLAFRMTGTRLSDQKAELTTADFIEFLLGLKGQSLVAWIRQERMERGTLLRSSLTTWKAS